MPVIEEPQTYKEVEDEWLDLCERRDEIQLALEHAKIDQAAGRPFNVQWFKKATYALGKIRMDIFRRRVWLDAENTKAKQKRKAENIAKAQSEADRRKNVKLEEFFLKTAKSILTPEQFQTILSLAQGRLDQHNKAKAQ